MIYTIGYADKPINTFVDQLKSLNVSFLVDIRSVPHSSYYKDFDSLNLPSLLREHGIKYVYMGNEFGPRSKNPLHYKPNGQIDFELLSKSDEFIRGVERLKKSAEYNICLMCAEKTPEVCHRTLLVARYAEKHGIDISAIGFDGKAESFSKMKERIMLEFGFAEDFFTTKEELQNKALDLLTAKHAYTNNNLSKEDKD